MVSPSDHSDEPIIQLTYQIIEEAIKHNASDIHIESYESYCRVRYRRDGILFEAHSFSIDTALRLIARIKVLAKLNSAERRLPQDGRFHFQGLDIRVNSCPLLFGEKIVLRLLDLTKITLSIENIGLDDQQLPQFIKKISEPSGLILVTGPTGSGKTVTLYSAIHYLNAIDKNISTVEDPIEIQMAGINQVNIHPKIGLNFHTVLRTFLRQDPDIIMIGEIRDKETAEIAVQAALTGHLVLSTLHTKNAEDAFHRLNALGVPFYYLANAITLIVAQRLIRQLCAHCKAEDLSATEWGTTTHYQAVGCDHCFKGYHGRIGIFELLSIHPAQSSFITENKTIPSDPNHSLKNKALQKVINGVTSVAEIQRVLQT